MMGVVFAIALFLGMPLAIFAMIFRSIEGRWPAFLDQRKPTQAVLLIRDMLRSGEGWSGGFTSYDSLKHNTGLSISRDFEQKVDGIVVQGKAIPLRSCDRRCLTRAVRKMLSAKQRVEADQALLSWAERVQQSAEKVVSIQSRRKAG